MLLRAALVAAAIVLPSLSIAAVNEVRYTSTVAAVDEQANTVTFTDRTQAQVDKKIPVTRELIGKRVEIAQPSDQDGNKPAVVLRVVD